MNFEKQKSPKRALQFLRWFCHEDHIEEIEGDNLILDKPRRGKMIIEKRQTIKHNPEGVI